MHPAFLTVTIWQGWGAGRGEVGGRRDGLLLFFLNRLLPIYGFDLCHGEDHRVGSRCREFTRVCEACVANTHIDTVYHTWCRPQTKSHQTVDFVWFFPFKNHVFSTDPVSLNFAQKIKGSRKIIGEETACIPRLVDSLVVNTHQDTGEIDKLGERAMFRKTADVITFSVERRRLGDVRDKAHTWWQDGKSRQITLKNEILPWIFQPPVRKKEKQPRAAFPASVNVNKPSTLAFFKFNFVVGFLFGGRTCDLDLLSAYAGS